MLRTRVQLSGGVTGPGVSTMYWDGDNTAAGATAARGALSTFWTAMLPRMVTYLLVDLDPAVDVVDPITGHTTGVHNVTGFHLVGTASGQALPVATQGLIQWRTGIFRLGGTVRPRSKEVRGRTYIPAPVEVDNDVGNPIAAYVSALQAAANNLVAFSPPKLCVYSRAHGAPDAVTSATVWTKWGVLRSRRD